MIIYHGSASRPKIEKVKNIAPSYEHGVEFAPTKIWDIDVRYIFDNGAYKAWANNEVWDYDLFLRRLLHLEEKVGHEPDFVVLPDVVTDSTKTYERVEIWEPYIDYPTAMPVQDGMKPMGVVEKANNLGCVALFIGGTMEYKKNNAPKLVELGHEHGLQVHVARPGDIVWAESIGADSVDTTTIIAWENWEKLKSAEEQQTLA